MDDDSNQTGILDFGKFEELFHKNHQFLCMVAVKLVKDEYTAKDLVQEFFIKFWENRNNIQLKVNFESYAYRSVRNRCIDYLRRQVAADKRNAEIPPNDEEDEEDFELTARDKRLRKVLQLLDELPSERRKVFELHAMEALTYHQIAEKLGISVNTVKTQLRRAYSTLRGKAIVILILGFLIKFL